MSISDARFLLAGSSVVSYAIYKRFEPTNVLVGIFLLLVVPALLAAPLRPQSSFIGALFIACTSYWSLLVLQIVLYRLSPFHPLARFPGPFKYKISKLFIARTTTGRKAYLEVCKMHEQYGDVVRIGPNEISLRHRDAILPVLGPKGLLKGPYYDPRSGLDGIRNIEHHAVRRKPWTRGMNSAAIKVYSDIVENKVHVLLDSLDKCVGEPTDLAGYMTRFGFDFMEQMAFSVDSGLLEHTGNSEGMQFLHNLHQGIRETAAIAHLPWIVDIIKQIPVLMKILDMEVIRTWAADHVSRRVQAGSNHRDLFHYLIGEDEEKSVSSSEKTMLATMDGVLAIIAGSDTAATCLAHLWYFLLRNPQCYARLQQEIDVAFPQGEGVMDSTKHTEMPYLNACINESLRMFPPVLTGLQRRVERGTGGKMIGKFFIPEDTQVSIPAYSLHRDPRCFSPMPDVFWPDRWLTEDKYTLPTGEVIPQDKLVHDTTAFIPFSFGPQNCVGKNVAMVEMRAVVCAVMHKFDIMAAKGSDLDDWEKNIEDNYVTYFGPLLVNLKAR